MPESLVESQLFGHVKALSPVQVLQRRTFEEANGGHSFLMTSIVLVQPFKLKYCMSLNRRVFIRLRVQSELM
jgi:transcriptional regulator of aromatic amino acid metabolism